MPLNYDLLHAICLYCNTHSLKNFNLLSKKCNRVASDLLIHIFSETELHLINEYHQRIYLKCLIIPFALCHQIFILDLSFANLTSLPESIVNLTQLQELYVYHNQLTFLPESIGNLTQLLHLSVFNNQLSSLPENVRNIKGIRIIE